MKTIKFIAITALWTLTSAAFSHESAHHARPAPATAAVQQDWGIAGDARAVQRTVTLRMTDDMRFTPRHITVREGETLRLRAENRGKVLHEIVLGTREALQAHAEMMVRHPGMEHDEAHMAHVAPGQRGDVIWQFNRTGTFDFACLIPGHYQAGMTGTIEVLPRKP